MPLVMTLSIPDNKVIDAGRPLEQVTTLATKMDKYSKKKKYRPWT